MLPAVRNRPLAAGRRPASPASTAPAVEGRIGQAAVPGTCGELFQGLLDGQPCLVSCPIDAYSRAQVRLVPGAREWHSPQPVSKTLRAVRLAAEWLGLAEAGRVQIESGLPAGRGYGASTADIGAALRALARAAGRALGPAQTARLAAQVEPTDSSLLPGLALFAHRQGRVRRRLGRAPRLAVLVLDPGGQVDTLAYNRQVTSETLRPFAARHREAFGLLQAGLAEGDWPGLGRGATLSAQTHQAVLFNPWLDAALDVGRAVGGLGVCRAHSGTILGVLLDPARTDPAEAEQAAAWRLPGQVTVRRRWLVDGGAR